MFNNVNNLKIQIGGFTTIKETQEEAVREFTKDAPMHSFYELQSCSVYYIAIESPQQAKSKQVQNAVKKLMKDGVMSFAINFSFEFTADSKTLNNCTEVLRVMKNKIAFSIS